MLGPASPTRARPGRERRTTDSRRRRMTPSPRRVLRALPLHRRPSGRHGLFGPWTRCRSGGQDAPLGSAVVSILDDARAGMNLDIRPQDDLFGHVNGRWLEEEEIPSDRSSWGPFVQLADDAEEQVHAIIESLAAERRRRRRTPARSPRSTPRSWTRRPIEELGLEPLRPVLDAAASCATYATWPAFLGEFERTGGSGLFRSYVDNDDRDAERYIVYFAAGRARPARRVLLPRRQVRRDPRQVRRPPRHHVRPGRARRPRGRAPRPCCASRPGWPRATGSAPRPATSSRPTTSRPSPSSTQLCPAFDWDGWVRNLGGGRRHAVRGLRPPAVLPRAPLDGASRRRPSRTGGPTCWPRWSAPRRRTCPTPSCRPTSTSTAAPSTARPSCGPAGSAASRWSRASMGEAVGREYVERHFPPRSKAMMDELVANLSRPTAARSPTSSG